MSTIDIASDEWLEYEALEASVYENFLSKSVEEMERLPDNPDLVAFRENQGWSQDDLNLAHDLSFRAYKEDPSWMEGMLSD